MWWVPFPAFILPSGSDGKMPADQRRPALVAGAESGAERGSRQAARSVRRGAASAEEPVAGPAVRGPSEVPRWGTL
ncbi:hypothetical protein BCONGLO52_29640 [Brachybacterium conglomeratum]|uniref:Uncharacterized protein n=1 Tax=Brachybacterium conglomeratum TaxID=47846 RepID=A0ABQ5RJS2_9MICO|nr:hypothetical protein BCONGLO52_29640 [Brachybacterium conglomeratum]GLK03657.1 hypothetical protein GCM10017597_04560 [Brachybacterium conglomeratum]